jgi:hypothetical protein
MSALKRSSLRFASRANPSATVHPALVFQQSGSGLDLTASNVRVLKPFSHSASSIASNWPCLAAAQAASAAAVAT